MNEEFNKLILADGVEIGKSIFDNEMPGEKKKDSLVMGGRLDFKVPEGTDLVILMGNRGGGYVPYQCLLPHQVYVDDIKKAFEKGYEVIYIVPISARAPFRIAYRGEYGKQRWAPKPFSL